MKLWVDDVRPAPEGYIWCKSVNETIAKIVDCEIWKEAFAGKPMGYAITLIDIAHDAGLYTNDGGDYIKLLDWLEMTGRNYPIRIHSMNPVGVQNMRAIIEHNGWTEVK